MKEQLTQLIEAFGAARYSQNQTLIEMSATNLREFLSKVEIVEMPPRPQMPPLQQEVLPTE